MRFGILSQYYPPEIGAPQARLSALARRLAEQGHEVHVLTAMPNYPKGRIYPGYGGVLRSETLDGVNVLRTCVYPTKSAGMAKRLSNYLSFALSSAIAGAALLPRLDYLMTESPPLFLGLTGYFLARIKRSKWIFNVSDLWPDGVVRLGAVKNGRALRFAYALEAFCYRKAWLITGQSKGILENIRDRFPHLSTYHLSNGVDTNLFAPARRDDAIRERLLGNGSCLVMYVGLHGVAQGLEQVLDAAVELRDCEGLRFVLVGEGPEKEALIGRTQQLGLKNVRFENPVPARQVPSLLASADVVLVPLKMHLPGAVPSKLYEAMASGRPVLLAASGEPAAIVRESGAGAVVEPGDSAAMASALREFYIDSDRRDEIGRNGRRAAVERFDRWAIVDPFINELVKDLEKDLACSFAAS